MLKTFLALFLVAAPLAADCNYTLRSSEPFRSTVSDVSVDGNDLWAATSYGVALFDRSVDPPRPVSSVALPGPTNRIRASLGVAYASSGTRIYVIRKGRHLSVVRSVDAGATINELLLAQNYLYAATSTGVVQLSLFDPETPSVINRLTTSSGQAFSLARLDATLYAADGDNSIEAYSIQIPTTPQKIGTFNTTFRAVSVRNASGRLYASDGISTDLFFGSGSAMSRVSTTPHGATSLFPLAGDVVFAAGIDRRIRAIDFSLPLQPTVVFETEIAPSEGSVNRVLALSGAPGRLYVAAGDRGVVTFDTSAFTQPFPLVRNAAPLVRSIVSLGDSVIVADDEAGLRRYSQAATGRLSSPVLWDATRRSVVHDVAPQRLLSSSGVLLNLWDLTKSPPERIGNFSFPSPIRSAVLLNTIAYAALSDQTVWRVNFADNPATAARIATAPPAVSLARSGNAVALVQLSEEGATRVHYYRSGDLTATAETAAIEGAATTGVAISADGLVAASTFKGISIVRFPNTTPEIIPSSATGPARGIALSGSELLVLTEQGVEVWDLTAKRLSRSYPIASELYAMALSADPARKIVSVATAEGIASVLFGSASRLPDEIEQIDFNRYYRKMIATDTALLLGSQDRRFIDRFLIDSSGIPRLSQRIALASPSLDFVEIGGTIFALSTAGKISAYTAAGTFLFDYQVEEGSTISPIAMHAVNGALWVSLLKDCPGPSCARLTQVFDPRNGRIVPTVSMTGEVLDLATSGTAAYVLTSAPSEIRVFNTADPYHPLMLTSRASQGAATSIAYDAATKTVYTLGDKIRVYSEISLAESGAAIDVAGTGTVDQRLRLLTGCAIVTGRGFEAQLLSAAWQPVPAPPTPSSVKAIATRGGVVYLLTDHSLDVWSAGVTRRKRGARM